MKINNLKINKRKLASLFLALGICLTSYKSNADIISYNNKATLKDGRDVMVYFTTGNTDNDYAYVSYDGLVGYLPLNYININHTVVNSDYQEINRELTINADTANIYNTPNTNDKINTVLHKGDKVSVVAKSTNGWYIVVNNNYSGFIEEKAFKNQNKKEKMIKITGNNVNIRLSPNTNIKDNIIGTANKDELYKYINHKDTWYVIDYYGQNVYISDKYCEAIDIDTEEIRTIQDNNKVLMAKVLGNNINVRSTPNMNNKNNIIGFADQTDYFSIIDKENDWYVIDYLGKHGYIYGKYVEEREVNKEDLQITKMVYVSRETEFYKEKGNNYLSTLPQYQLASVIKEDNGYYKVSIDGVIGYIKKKDTANLTKTFIVSDLGRQIVKVYQNNKEVHRAHMISGRKSMPTDIGVFKIGHKLRDYQLTPDIIVKLWMQYNGNEGFHDAPWQLHVYFMEVAKKAYEQFASGKAKTYPSEHGSHGCDNLEEEDAEIIYNIIHVGDNVLVVVPNDFIKNNLICDYYALKNQIVASLLSTDEKVKKLV